MSTTNFLSAAQLGIPEQHAAALVTTLLMMESGKLRHVGYNPIDVIETEGEFTGHFNMNIWRGVAPCGTVCCIGGTAELVGKVDFRDHRSQALDDLFYPPLSEDIGTYADITVAQAARALRNYLETGAPCWQEVLGTEKEEETVS